MGSVGPAVGRGAHIASAPDGSASRTKLSRTREPPDGAGCRPGSVPQAPVSSK